MGLDDIVKDSEVKSENEDLEELKDELGLEDKEDLELLEDRLSRLAKIIVHLDRKTEMITEDVNELIRDMRDIKEKVDQEETEDGDGDDALWG